MTAPRQTVVLLYPRAEPDWPDPEKIQGLPLAVLTVARSLVAEGYDVRIVDENVERRPLDRLGEMPRPLFVGISVIGGYTIRAGMQLAEAVARLWPGVPRVWGGWNPTLVPHLYEDPGAARWVDVVVRGRGEATALAIARRLGAGEGLAGLPGVSWRGPDGTATREPDAPLDDPTHAGPLPYDLIGETSRYVTRHGMVNFITSYGCPHRCTFCGIPAYTRTFKPTDSGVVVEQLGLLTERGIRTFLFLDDNFFTSRDRVVDLAQRLIAADLGVEWHSNGRLDQVLALSEEELALAARSGCRSINVGLETGEQATADAIKKDVVVGDAEELARRFARTGIHLSINVMIGLPGETEASLWRSLESLKVLHAIQPDLEACWYMCMPAPGTEMWRDLVAQGVLTEPRDLLDHTRLQSLYLEHPWYYESPPRDVYREARSGQKALAWTFWMAYVAAPPGNALLRAPFGWLRARARRRWEVDRRALGVAWRVAFEWNRWRVRARWLRAALLRTRRLDAWDRRKAARRPEAQREGITLLTGVHRST